MRLPLPFLTVLSASILLAACGQKKSDEDGQSSPPQSAAREATGPGIDRALAPGVAFAFNYDFILPATAITPTQREHAAACSRLGIDRCRVTAMTYDQPSQGEVEARIAFLLAPDLAQSFAAEGVAAVEKAEGKLESARVEGENAGEAITLSQQDSAGIEAETKRIEARLAKAGLSGQERAELRQQIATLREQLRGNAQERRNKETAIASTPVVFNYSSGGLLDSANPVSRAAEASWSSTRSAFSFALMAAALGLPWAALALAIWFGWRLLRRKSAAAEPVRQD